MRPMREARFRKVAPIVGVFVILVGVAVGAFIYRSQVIEQDQEVFPLGLSVSPNPFPGIGLDNNREGTFNLDLTVSNSFLNPNMTVMVFVQPTSNSTDLNVFHCLLNSQENLSALNKNCADDAFWQGNGVYTVNVTSGSTEVLEVSVLFIGSITEPVSVKWLFFAEGEEIP